MSLLRSTLIVAVVSLAVAAPPARAGIADSPLPVLVAGQATLHLYSVPGIRGDGGLGSFFSCTSTDTAPMQVGVEIFGSAGGAPAGSDLYCAKAASEQTNSPTSVLIISMLPR